MVGRILRLLPENKAEVLATIPEITVIPRKTEIVTIVNNKFVVTQIEWFPLNQEVFVYVQDEVAQDL
jgi:hypothetical protein